MRVREATRRPLGSARRLRAEAECGSDDGREGKRPERSGVPEHSTFRRVAVFVPLRDPST
jgi:hypothetical protein